MSKRTLLLGAGVFAACLLACPAAAQRAAGPATDVIVLDDSLSMTDRWKEGGAVKTAFAEGKRVVQRLVRNAAEADPPHPVKLFRLSEPDKPLYEDVPSRPTLNEVLDRIDKLQPTDLHLKPVAGVVAAGKARLKINDGPCVFHFVSDYRASDWSGDDAAALNKMVDRLSQTGARINLIDVAHPDRGKKEGSPEGHDNLALVSLTPEVPIAAEKTAVAFTLQIANLGAKEKTNVRVAVKADGAERFESSVPVPRLPTGFSAVSFRVTLVRPGFNRVSAHLDAEETGVPADNVCHAVVEVRNKVQVLVIDGAGADGLKAGGDTFHLKAALEAGKNGVEVMSRGAEALEGDLRPYLGVYLLNVPNLSKAAVKNLRDFVQEGGGLAYFLGDKVQAEHYNDVLYREGLFPVPLADTPSARLSAEQRAERQFDDHAKVFLRDAEHPLLADVFPLRSVFKFVSVDQHWPAAPRTQWNAELGRVRELMTLANYGSPDAHRAKGVELLKQLPAGEGALAPYKPALDAHRRAVRDALAGKSAPALAGAVEALLNDRGAPKDANKPGLGDFWTKDAVRELREKLATFLDEVRFGDALMVAGRPGKGRVVAFLTTAGKAWHDWAAGGLASTAYPVVVLELQKYLRGGGDPTSLSVGDPLVLRLDPNRYEPRVRCYFRPDGTDEKGGPLPLKDLGERAGTVNQGRAAIAFTDGHKPGLYLFDVYPVEDGKKPERRAFVFNVDTAAESDLKRAPREELERKVVGGIGKITLYSRGELPR